MDTQQESARREQSQGNPALSRPRLPPRLLVIDVIGMLLAALGLAGLLTELSGPLAFLANKQLSGIIAGVGFALVTFALGNIIRWHNRMRAVQQAQRNSGPPT